MKICPVCGIANPDEFNYCQQCPTQLGSVERGGVDETKTKARKYALVLGAAALGITVMGLWTSLRPQAEPKAETDPSPLLSHKLNTVSPAPAISATQPPVELVPLVPPKKATKEEIAELWKGIVSRVNPQLNYVDVKIQKAGKGYAIFATHEYFTRYTMSAGPDAEVCEEFIQLTREELRAANIVRVGYWGRGPYSSGVWLDVP